LYFSDPLDLMTGFGAAPASSIGVLFSQGGPDILASAASAAGFVQEYKTQAIGGLTLSPGEMVTVQMTLAPGNSAEAVRLALIDSNVRVIIATVGIGGPDRTVYMEATCCADVPEPPPQGLAGLGLAGLAAVLLRRRVCGGPHASRSLT
jgi:MYXO-CTERM domain-containing protein